MLADIVITILLIASTFYMTIVLLRFLLQLARADFYNPISQFVVKATNPPLRPLRRFMPPQPGMKRRRGRSGVSFRAGAALTAHPWYWRF